MLLFIDCEFNSWKGQLLSMALVPEDPNEPHFYEELVISESLDPWVREHVVLKKNPLTGLEFTRALESFLSRFDEVNVVADWPDDIKYFCERLIVGPGMAIKTPQISFSIRRDINADSEEPHYALADAKAIRDRYFSLTSSSVDKQTFERAVDEIKQEREREMALGTVSLDRAPMTVDATDEDHHVIPGSVVPKE